MSKNLKTLATHEVIFSFQSWKILWTPEYRDQHQAGIGVTVQSGVLWCVIVCYLIVLSVVVLACYCCVVVVWSTAISGWYHSDCETQWFLARRIIPRSLNSTKESMGFQCEQVCTFNDICWKSSANIYIFSFYTVKVVLFVSFLNKLRAQFIFALTML